MLLLHGNDVLSVERLSEGLWGDDAPASARKAIQVYVSRLRKVLGAERIRTTGPGYLLELRQDELDLDRFERLVEEARELRRRNEPALASGALREALALWHGSPLADLAEEPFAEPEIARLDGMRLAAIEERVDLDLALGRGAELLPELETLVSQNPYRERLRGQLMLALYRAGRQADALAAFQQARRLFVDELGIEPSPALQRLEQAILRQEAGLEALLEAVEDDSEPQEEALPTDAPAIQRSRFRRPLVALAALVLVGVAAAVAVGLAGKTQSRHGVDANAIGILDAEHARIDEQIPYGEPSNGIASDGKTVWLAGAADGTVTRFTPDRRPWVTTGLGSTDGVAYGSGSLWVTNSQRRELLQLRPDTSVVQHIRVGNGPHAVKVGRNAAWVANTIDGTVTRIDLDRKEAPQTIPVGPSPVGIAIGGGGVWVTTEGTTGVVRIDAESPRVVEPIPVGNGPSGIAYGEGAVWVANRDDGTVSRIDPTTRAVTNTIPGFDKPEAVLAAAGSIWVANTGDGTIKRIDPRDDPRIDATVELGSRATGLAFVDGKVWASTNAEGGHRGGVLRVESSQEACPSADPLEWPSECVIPPLVYDGLVAYRRVGGVAGETIVPDLAVRIPAATDDGRTYVFQLRPGLQYSNGAKVAASDFRYSIERLMRLRDGPGLLGAIAGASACSAKGCDLSKGIRVDDRARTITIRLSSADPDLLHKLALPYASIVPGTTPLRYAPSRPIPSIGPYRVASIDAAHEITLVRNRHFREWAPNARPDGYPDEIRVHLRANGEEGIASVKRGAADWVDLSLGGSTEQMRGLLTRYAGRLRSSLASESDWLFLNTRVPPFDDVRARRAVNFAIDRRRLVDLAGKQGPPSCQVLPPNVPEYRPYCPYTRRPNAANIWGAPDIAKAKALVTASGTAGMHVEVDSTPFRRTVSRYLASVLEKIGYRASVRVIYRKKDPYAYYSYVADSRNRAQIGWAGWVPDYLAAADFLQLFTCKALVPRSAANNNLFEFCDPALDAKMARAAAAQRSDPARARELWSAVDRELVDRAVAVPWSTPRRRALVSERVGNYQGHPLWGTLLDQLWVR